ncbi:MAG: peptidylprolyl isomerase [Methylococcales bacterium]|nr:peptidylprolyl isomerase [Methylococcales bacterium]MCK5924857.1 peptidylprolyl isomerase [Methylococcales bacterium]
MKKTLIIPLLLASSFLLVACDQSSEPTVKKENAVAVVNGTYISKSTLETLSKEIQQRSHGREFPKKQLLEELIQRELLVQDAKQKKLGQKEETAARIRMATRSLLSQATLKDYLKTSPVTDTDIKAEYDKEVAKTSGVEYKARHILLKTEEDAKAVLESLKAGANFKELAIKKSTGPSAPQGGDLGWFVEGQMVKEFTEAVKTLENGAYTKTPVKTQFGFHIVLREDSREQTPPPFDSIKEQLRPQLEQKKIQSMLENLREKAKVEILIPLDEPKTDVPAAPTKTAAEAAATATPAASEAPKIEKTPVTATPVATETPKKAEEAPKAAE